METCVENSISSTITVTEDSPTTPTHTSSTTNNGHGSSSSAYQEVEVKSDELVELVEYFAKTTYKARDTQPKVQQIMQKCLDLFGLDYKYSIIPNTAGELSTNYPSVLVVLEEEKSATNNSLRNCNGKYDCNGLSSSLKTSFVENGAKNGSSIVTNGEEHDGSNGTNGIHEIQDKTAFTNGSLATTTELSSNNSSGLSNGCSDGQEDINELPKMKDLCSKARFARCRARFPIPVILFNKKHVCRSATLSGGPEIYGRSSFDYFFSGGTDSRLDCVSDDELVLEAQSEWQLFDRVRSQDIRLLKAFKVHTIIDLMVEKKKVKFGVNVTSSEKVDKENRYADFNIVSLPYPGCEFFKQYRDNGYSGEQLVFEWNQGHVDANICVPSDPTAASLNLNWSQYRNWDLIALTQNYLKLLLGYLLEGQKGILVHCISGWDRTPLFISLLRLSLWADGVIHKSLDADQILYLTLAYDWLLFGHNLEDRLSKGEEILFFCFNFLKYIVEPSYCIDDIGNLSKQFKISKVRSDSDIHLEGILLDGSVTSPEGSNWSLNSCGSSQSNRSLSDSNPPSYFQVPPESFEDCSDVLPVFRNGKGSFPAQRVAQNPILRTCANSTSCLITNSMLNSITLNGSLETNVLNSQSPNSHNSSVLGLLSNNDSPPNCVKPSNGTCENKRLFGRTSPVPVPNHKLNQPRLESDSSASIGSWQLITGSGSLRDLVSSSDPGSNNSNHSNPLRVPNSEFDCIEPSESSCTLVEELTPVQRAPSLRLYNSMKPDSQNGVELEKINDDQKYEFEIGLAIDENLEKRVELNDNDLENLLSSKKSSAHLGLIGEEPLTLTSTPTDDEATPTLENENNNHIFSKRQEKLDAVRSKFYSLYSKAIGFQCRNVSDNNGGLGSLIGTFATKVGIRSATHRISHV